VDVLFAPEVADMYPRPMLTVVDVPDPRPSWKVRYGPVILPVSPPSSPSLFNIVQPHAAYFGEKDYQQVALIRRMVEDLGAARRVVAVPTVREADGLACSSRNVYLKRRSVPRP
jgi:pantoate--beta-alanine ligase